MNKNYIEIYDQIHFWKGIEKEYWKAVEILIREQRLKEIEIKTCKAGLTCFTGDLVTFKMKELADFCKTQIPETFSNEVISKMKTTPIKVSGMPSKKKKK
jgi:hypothetical protein